MKFELTFKTPGVIDRLLDEVTNETELAVAKELVEQFVSFGEYVTIQFDSEKRTAIVLHNSSVSFMRV